MQISNDLKRMMLGAIGIVYGDISTSPLYAFKSCFTLSMLPVIEANILGIISLFIWIIILMVTLKYVYILINIDNEGEGGILALALLCSKLKKSSIKFFPIALGIIGTALLIGDGVITPAISVLSALEGLQLITPLHSSHIVYLSTLILLALFVLQKRGSHIIGQYFGPIMLIWVLSLALLGIYNIFENFSILKALSPFYAIQFLTANGINGLLSFGGAILVVTGAEALYTDLGHFGKRPIQLSWTFFVLPALVLNYLGQGALILNNPTAIQSSFYNMVPASLLYPLIFIATLATIIASQSIISGVFSVCWQAIMLGYLPRMRIIHTSKYRGQVYIPTVNTMLMILTITAICIFKSSEELAIAYGLTVAGLMLITSILLIYIAINKWEWSITKTCLLFVPFLVVDTVFFSINITKVWHGAWYPLIITAIVTYIIWVWKSGNKLLSDQKLLCHLNLKSYLSTHKKHYKQRIPGCAIYMSHYPKKVPNALLINLKHNKLLHEKIILLTVVTADIPRVPKATKFLFEEIDKNIFVVTATFGFLEAPNLNEVTAWAYNGGILDTNQTVSCFLSKEIILAEPQNFIDKISRGLYVLLANNAFSMQDFFKIPNQKIVELVIKSKL